MRGAGNTKEREDEESTRQSPGPTFLLPAHLSTYEITHSAISRTRAAISGLRARSNLAEIDAIRGR